MIAHSRRLAFPRWFGPVAGAALAISVAASSCGQRSLVEVDVLADTPFQGVTLRLIAGGSSKDFVGVSFTAAMPYKAGLYLPDSASGTVTLVANALDGAGHCLGSGQTTVTGVNAGTIAGPFSVTVTHTSVCPSGASGTGGTGPSGTGGSNGGGGSGVGTGGTSGGGIGGTSGGTGGSGVGGTNGGTGGTTAGTGGQVGANIIVNGDFSNGETGWGLPAMLGTVSHAVTNGAFCVTLGSASSATVGYPSGGASPFPINSGISYRFSYQASVSGTMTFEAKVGQTLTPYDATGSDWMNEPVGTTLQTFTHTFSRAATDNSMGVAFNLMGGPGTACVDNVTLTTN
jgi:hypothetical protein